MRIATALAFVAATLGGTTTAALAAPPTGTVLAAGSAAAIGDSYIVVLRPGERAVASEAGRLLRRYGGQVAGTYATAVRGFHARMTAAEAGHLAADPAVRYVEQDATVGAAETASWGLDRIDQRGLPLSGSHRTRSAAGVTAYVLDSGIRTGHREFGGRASDGWDFVDGDPVADDCNGHGTHVAGTIGGATYGVAPDVRLVGVKVLNCAGTGSYASIIAGVDWVTAHATRPAVANMSLGGSASRALDDAVARSIASGVTYAVAAGNDHRDACRQSPARTPAAITVGATGADDRRSSFSNYGSCLDLFAPGARIRSASNASNTATKLMSGTSMASPHVAGAAALLLAAHPTWSPSQVRDELVGGATTGVVRDAGPASPDRLLYLGPAAG